MVNHLWFAKLKPSKLVLRIDNLLGDLLIRQTFFRQMLEKSWLTKLSPRQTFPLYGNHSAIAIFDNFHGQTTADILYHLKSHNIVPLQLPANCTDKLQPLDKPMKNYLKNRFQQWYVQEVKKQFHLVKSKWMLPCRL